MIKRSFFTSITVGIISLLVLAESAPAGLMNGDFSSNLSVNWNSSGVFGVYRFHEKAIINEGRYDDSNPNALPPKIFYLEQLIDVEAGLQELSFDILINTGGGETDYFDVTLGGSPIYNWDTGDGPLPLTTITHHINSLGPQNLRFELRFDFDNNKYSPTSIELDNVALTPVPGAVLLGMLGLGVAGVKLRKFA